MLLSLIVWSFVLFFLQETHHQSVQLKNNELFYSTDSEGNRVPDFSRVGYHYGSEDPPSNLTVVLTLSPNDTMSLQDAIEKVQGMNSSGESKVIQLTSGTFLINDTIRIQQSGIVLRGEGKNKTILVGLKPQNSQLQKAVLMFQGRSLAVSNVSTATKFYAASNISIGDSSIELTSPPTFQENDMIAISQVLTSQWLSMVQSDGGVTDLWTLANFDPIVFYRKVVQIQNTLVELDAPFTTHLDLNFGQVYVIKLDDTITQGILSEVGVEDLSIEIEVDGPTDEQHFWMGVQFSGVQNFWATNICVSGFAYSAILVNDAYLGTVKSCDASHPSAQMIPERMYNFCANRRSQQILFSGLTSQGGRHPFMVNGAAQSSGIVFFNSTSWQQHDTVESHRRWSTGVLFDNVNIMEANSTLGITFGLYNRGDFGGGHGWACAHCVAWNLVTTSPVIIQKPPTSQNYCIGCKVASFKTGIFPGAMGCIESINTTVTPVSLYLAQLQMQPSAQPTSTPPGNEAIGLAPNWLLICAMGLTLKYYFYPFL